MSDQVEMARVPDLARDDIVVTETGVYRVLETHRYPPEPAYTGGPGSPAGIPCWHISVATVAGAARGGLVRTDWDYLQCFRALLAPADVAARAAGEETDHG